ncbi:MAG TPA: type II toxin-antitoxin system PemK/MazF family toxin [Terriglobia bacterium]|jgi:mRNA-degrading endonuclease toxin of MazEF toxin-antitoxin module
MTRGTVIWVDLTDATPPEMGKRRPAVIVSNSIQNLSLDSVVAVPLSSRAPEIPPLRLEIRPTGLKGAGYAVVPAIRRLKKSRILGTAGKLKPPEMERLDRAISEYLSD